jgi:hypothetical protein
MLLLIERMEVQLPFVGVDWNNSLYKLLVLEIRIWICRTSSCKDDVVDNANGCFVVICWSRRLEQ